MNESEIPEAEVSLPISAGRQSPKRCSVTLPQGDFITCTELAHQIADAVDPWRSNARSGYPVRRLTWSDANTSGSPYPRSKPTRLLIQHLRQYRGAPYSARWDPSMASIKEGDPHLARWLEEVERRLNDLQRWVDRGEFSIFGSDWVKYKRIAHDTYVKRQDAVRYCLESGFDVASPDTTTKGSADAALALQVHVPSVAEQRQPTLSKAGADSPPQGQDAAQRATVASTPASSMLRPKTVMARTGLARSTFYERQNPKSRYFDPSFPRARSLGEGSVGYLETEVDQWIAARPAARR
jgi:prophage regulatory protein